MMLEPTISRRRMRGLAWCGVALGWLLCGPLGWADEARPLDAAQAARLIRELDHEDYEVRTRATKELARADGEALSPLIEALKSGSLERRMRLVDLLGKIYSRGDERSFEAAEIALEDVRQSGSGSLSAQARAVLDANYDVREKLAVNAIRELGGSVLYKAQTNPSDDGDPAEGPHAAARSIAAVVVGQDWTGGDDGLRHIRRLSRLEVLYHVKKAPISAEAMEALQAAMPRLNVTSRGPAYLGIMQSRANFARGCAIGDVTPNAAAAKAGIRPNDVITHFDGQPVGDFNELIELIAGKLPGDAVPITVERDGESLELKTELTGWPKESFPPPKEPPQKEPPP